MNYKDFFNMDVGKISKSKVFKNTFVFIISVIVILGSFKAGEIVGFRKALFIRGWTTNYQRNFGGPRNGFDSWPATGIPSDPRMDAINGHGTFGKVIKSENASLVVSDRDALEKVINVASDTPVMLFHDNVGLSAVQPGDMVIIIGKPNDAGQIDAKFIRIFPKR